MKINLFIKKISVFSTKKFSSKINTDRYGNVENFYHFMDQNLQIKGKKYENKKIDDLKVLLSIVKCPMTNSDLETSEEGLKIAVKIIYLSILLTQRRMAFIT